MKTFTVCEKAKKGILLNCSTEGPSDLLGIPIGQGLMRDFKDAGVTEAKMQWLDVVPDNDKFRLIKEQSIKDRRALVLVETVPGVGGKLKLSANTVIESFNERRQRVERTAAPWPPPGITPIAEVVNAWGWSNFLFTMMPGASFRITRTGKLEGAPPEMVVLWNARWDHRAEFDDFRNPTHTLIEKVKADRKMRAQHEELYQNLYPKDRPRYEPTCTAYEHASVEYMEDPMKFWGLQVYYRNTRHADV